MLPVAGAIAVVAPLSSQLVRRLGTKLTITVGLLLAAGGLWQISGATIATTYSDIVVGMTLLGIGAGLIIPTTAASVMGSLPEEHTGVSAGTNGTFLQAGGALGVAVIGSLLATRYQNDMITALAPHPIPHSIEQTILGSIGGALGVAQHLGGVAGAFISHSANSAFISGMDLGLRTAAIVALAGAVFALAILPARRPRHRTRSRAIRTGQQTDVTDSPSAPRSAGPLSSSADHT